MSDTIDFITDALDSLMQAGKIIIEKEENSIDIKVRVDTDKPMLIGLLFMESMLSIAKRSKMHEFSIASAILQRKASLLVRDQRRRERDPRQAIHLRYQGSRQAKIYSIK